MSKQSEQYTTWNGEDGEFNVMWNGYLYPNCIASDGMMYDEITGREWTAQDCILILVGSWL